MPEGPQGQRTPADMVGCATLVAELATGEVREELREKFGKVRPGQAGRTARVSKLSLEERMTIAKKAVVGRWG